LRRHVLLGLLALGGCAHGGKGAGVRSHPHAPLTLVSVSGLSETQEPVVEGAICQGLVDGNGGDVACPESTRQAMEVARMRGMATSDTSAAEAMAANLERPSAQVSAEVTREGEAYLLTLQYRGAPGVAPTAQRTFRASSFEALVEGATGEARALLE
jgi:hypothetical protein